MNSCSSAARRLSLSGEVVHRLRDLGDLGLGVRQELVQRRIEEADRHRQAAHDREELGEVVALHRQELRERGAPARLVVGEDHLAHGEDAVALEEHVLGAAEPDALGAEVARRARVERRVGVGADLELARLSAQPMRVANSPESSGSSIATSPCSTWPVEPSMVMMSPFFSVTPATLIVCAA